MRIVDCGSAVGRVLTAEHWGTRNAVFVPVARTADGVAAGYAVDLMHLGPDSVLGRHPAGPPQLFAVAAGAGWVSGADRTRVPIRAGQAAYREPGESHESGSIEGMTVLIVQSDTSRPGSLLGDLLGAAGA